MQHFYINKDSTLPLLKMELIQDGRNNYNNFFELFQNGEEILFNMINVETGVVKIANGKAFPLLKNEEGCVEEYYICYQWKKRDTMIPGKYKGQFTFKINNENLIVPIQDDLIIYIK